MCKPGSACCGCGVGSSGIGMAVAAVAAVSAASMAATFISDILTAMLVGVLSIAAGGSIMLAVILRRTRGVATWRPGRARPVGAGAPPVRAWTRPVRVLVSQPARAAVTARRRQAIEAPAPVPVRSAPVPVRSVPALRIAAPPGSPGLAPPGSPGLARPGEPSPVRETEPEGTAPAVLLGQR